MVQKRVVENNETKTVVGKAPLCKKSNRLPSIEATAMLLIKYQQG